MDRHDIAATADVFPQRVCAVDALIAPEMLGVLLPAPPQAAETISQRYFETW